jgi:hypothetical protein
VKGNIANVNGKIRKSEGEHYKCKWEEDKNVNGKIKK